MVDKNKADLVSWEKCRSFSGMSISQADVQILGGKVVGIARVRAKRPRIWVTSGLRMRI